MPAATGEAIESGNPRERENARTRGMTRNYNCVGPRWDKLSAVGEGIKVMASPPPDADDGATHADGS